MAEESERRSPIRSTLGGCTCGWALSRELGPFSWPMPVLQFSVHLIHLLRILLRCNGFTGIHKAAVDQRGSRAPNSDHDPLLVQVWLWEVLWSLLLVKFGFRKCFGASSWSNHWAGHRQLYKIYFSSHVTVQSRNGSLLLHRIREDDSFSKRRFLNFRSAHEAPTYGASSPFQFTSNVQQP